jgi:hypothetical protein
VELKLRARTTAAVLYGLGAAAFAGLWFLTLSVGNVPVATPPNTLQDLLSNGPSPMIFHWYLLVPFLCLTLMGAYLSELARTSFGLNLLFALGVALAVSLCATVTLGFAIPVFVALYFGYRARIEQREASRAR